MSSLFRKKLCIRKNPINLGESKRFPKVKIKSFKKHDNKTMWANRRNAKTIERHARSFYMYKYLQTAAA